MKSIAKWAWFGVVAATVVALFAMTETHGEPQNQVAEGTYYSVVEMDCMDVKVKLSRIHEADSLLRVNAGQSYKVISGKLMSRLHAKIVEDRLDGSALVKKAATFEDRLNDFRMHYQEYEVALNELLKMDCVGQEQLFYSTLRQVRQKRDIVHGDIQQLDQQIKDYRVEVRDFKKSFSQSEGLDE